MSDIVDFYRESLKPLRLGVNADGLVAPLKTPNEPLHNNRGARWAFPGHAPGSEDTVYNPANEPALDDDLLRKLTKRMEQHVGSNVMALIMNVMVVCVDPERHRNIPAKAGTFLKAVNRVDANTVKFFTKFLVHWADKLKGNPKMQFASFKVIPNRQINGVSFTRTGVFFCPIFEYFKEDTEKSAEGFSLKNPFKFAGVSCRSSDMDTMRAFINFIFPNVNEHLGESPWFAGVRHPFGNTFFAAFRVYEKVLKRIKELNDSLGSAKDDSGIEVDEIDLSWAELFDKAMADQAGLDAIKTPASYHHSQQKIVETKPTLNSIEPAKKPALSLIDKPAVGAKKLSLSDLGPKSSSPVTQAGGKGTVINTANGSFLVVGDNAIPITGNSAPQGPGAGLRIPVMTGNPYRAQNGDYVCMYDDGLARPVVFNNGSWVPLQPVQPVPTNPRLAAQQAQNNYNNGYGGQTGYYPPSYGNQGSARGGNNGYPQDIQNPY